jgi:hypothetical protein
MGFPFEHVGQRDATGDSSSEIDSHFHSEIGLKPSVSRAANIPTPELPGSSFSSPCLTKSSA